MNTINLKNHVNMKGNYPLWHPNSNNRITYFDKSIIVAGEGPYLYDDHGMQYYDLDNGFGNVILGYGNEDMVEAISYGMRKLSFYCSEDFLNPIELKAANMLLDIMGYPMKKVAFGNSASEGLELAACMMRRYWEYRGNKNKKNIYHIEDKFALTKIEADILSNFETIAGIKITTLQAIHYTNESGIANFDKLLQLCKSKNVLILFDETLFSIYRTGTDFYYKVFKIRPDIVCLANGLNSGYLPLSATIISEGMNNLFLEHDFILPTDMIRNGSNVAAYSSLIKTIEYIKNNNASSVIAKASEELYLAIRSLLDISFVKKIQYLGYFFDVQLEVKNYEIKLADTLYLAKQLRRKGLIVRAYNQGIYLFPMYNASVRDWSNIAGILKDVFEQVD